MLTLVLAAVLVPAVFTDAADAAMDGFTAWDKTDYLPTGRRDTDTPIGDNIIGGSAPTNTNLGVGGTQQ